MTVLLLLGVLSAPADAASGDIAASDFFPVFGPRLSGETVLWTVPRRDQGFVMRRGRPSSDQSQAVFTAKSQRNRQVSLRWVASPQEILIQQALVDTAGDDPAGGLAIDRGTSRLLPGGRLEDLAPGRFPNIGNFDLDGSVGVFPEGESDNALVRDFSQASSARRIEGVGSVLKIAGRYVAWITENAVVIYDYTTMSEVYRIARPAEGGLQDLQADGKVAVSYEAPGGNPRQRTLGWASPAEPFLHALAVQPAPGYVAKLGNDVIVFERNKSSLAPTARGELGYVPLEREEKILARSVETTAGGPDELFDFDGEQVAWLDRTCAGARVRVASLAELVAQPRSAPNRRCRLRLATKPRLTPRGDLRFRASCVGFVRDCNVFGATLRLARTYRVHGRVLRKGTRLFAKRADRLSSVGRFKLSRQTQRLLRRRGRVRLVLRVRMGDSGSTPLRQVVVAVR